MSRKLANLMFDNADYVCLKLLLLSNPEVQTLRNQSLVQEFNKQVQQTLHEYCSYSWVPGKFNQLVNLLPDSLWNAFKPRRVIIFIQLPNSNKESKHHFKFILTYF